MSSFHQWLDTFMSEKGYDLGEGFEIDGPSGINYMTYQLIVDHIKMSTDKEQRAIKEILIKMDFKNADIKHFLRHLGQAIAL